MTDQNSISTDAARFARLFRGYDSRYGRFELTHREDSGKMAGRASTVDDRPELNNYKAHLSGECGIGIIPLTQSNKVHFAAVDIDRYGAHEDFYVGLAKRVRNLPLVATRSKSGGIHLWLFSGEGVPASAAVDFLQEVCAQVGVGGSEIFPKQVVRASREDVGNWINLPYFGRTRKVLSIVEKDGVLSVGPDSLEMFFKLAEFTAAAVTEEWLASFAENIKSERADVGASKDWYDGPPCLQRLFVGDEVRLKKIDKQLKDGKITKEQHKEMKDAECLPQLSEGGRNVAFFNAGQYLFRKYGLGGADIVKDKLTEVNVASALGLPVREIDLVVKQGEKKEYNYQCNQEPLCSFCNRSLCTRRKFGIGSKPVDVPVEVSGFTKILTDPPIFAFNIDNKRIKMDAERLLSQKDFSVAVLNYSSKVWVMLPDAKFKELLSSWIGNMTEIDGPPDVDDVSVVRAALITYIQEKRNLSNSDEAYHNGRVLLRNDDVEAWFDLKFFVRFLKRDGLNMTRREISDSLEKIGCKYCKSTTTIAKKTCRPWIAYPGELE